MLNDIKALDTHSLLEFLNKHNERLHLDNEDFDILKNNKVSGANFLLLKNKDLLKCGLKIGPVVSLRQFIKDINSGKVRYRFLILIIKFIEQLIIS
jgi:hypothetical protein